MFDTPHINLTNFMQQIPSWEANSYSTGREVSSLFVTQKAITMFKSKPYPEPDEHRNLF
jgi:hypothetical protein